MNETVLAYQEIVIISWVEQSEKQRKYNYKAVKNLLHHGGKIEKM